MVAAKRDMPSRCFSKCSRSFSWGRREAEEEISHTRHGEASWDESGKAPPPPPPLLLLLLLLMLLPVLQLAAWLLCLLGWHAYCNGRLNRFFLLPLLARLCRREHLLETPRNFLPAKGHRKRIALIVHTTRVSLFECFPYLCPGPVLVK